MNRLACLACSVVCALGCSKASKTTEDAAVDQSGSSLADFSGPDLLVPVDDLSEPPDLTPLEDLSVGTYDPCPAAGTACKVMPLGDSITFGYQSSTGGGYRVELFTKAVNAKQDITFVGSQSTGPTMVDGMTFPKSNEGHSGYTIENGAGRNGIEELTANALTTYKPNIVLLMIGTNDVDTMNDLANAPSRFATEVDLIFKTSPNVLLVAALITPTESATENMLVSTYNTGIAKVIATNKAAGKHILMVDMYAAFMKDKTYVADYMHDNLHPNDTGYAVMGDVWYAAIGSLLK